MSKFIVDLSQPGFQFQKLFEPNQITFKLTRFKKVSKDVPSRLEFLIVTLK